MNFDVAQFLVRDAAIAGGVIVAAFLFMYTVGKQSFVPAFTALALAAAFSSIVTLPTALPVIGSWPVYQQYILLFALVAIIAFFVFRRHIYFEPVAIPGGIERPVCAVLLAGFVLAVVGSFLPASEIATLSPNIRTVFVNEIPQALWLIAPVIALIGMKGE
jgi:hypothetical protein